MNPIIDELEKSYLKENTPDANPGDTVKVFADPKTMGINIDKNEYYEIILSNSAHPENIKS